MARRARLAHVAVHVLRCAALGDGRAVARVGTIAARTAAVTRLDELVGFASRAAELADVFGAENRHGHTLCASEARLGHGLAADFLGFRAPLVLRIQKQYFLFQARPELLAL